jgi:hypothetical protein
VVLGFNNEVLVERITSPIPRQKDVLNPHQSMDIDLNMEPIPELIMDMKVEIHALKVK